MINTVKVRVPATTANCGPGFDSLGIACTLYNELELTLLPDSRKIIIEVAGEGCGIIPTNESNVAVRAISKIFSLHGIKQQGMFVKMKNNIPLSRGLGSSAAAIVAGLVAANEVTGGKLDSEEIFSLASGIEGHPDNVAPAIYGGVTVSVMKEDLSVSCLRFVPPKPFSMIVAIPEFHLSTKAARQALPANVSFQDAVFNVSRTSLLVAALCQGELALLSDALQDRLHQPYRQKLIPGMPEVLAAATQAGALGATLSGAGPCLIAFAQDNAQKIGEAMIKAFASKQVVARYVVLEIALQGATIV